MFTERELLILSYAVDKTAHTMKAGELFFSPDDAIAVCGKIHNVLRGMRRAAADRDAYNAKYKD